MVKMDILIKFTAVNGLFHFVMKGILLAIINNVSRETLKTDYLEM